VIMYENEPIFCKSVSFTLKNLNLMGYFFHDTKRVDPDQMHSYI